MFNGSEVSVDRNADDGWTIYRFNEAGEVTQIILPTQAMDELLVYFTRDYAKQRDEIAAMQEP